MSRVWLLSVPTVAKSSGISFEWLLHNTLGTGTTAAVAAGFKPPPPRCVESLVSSPLPENRARNTTAPCQTLWIYALPPQFNSGGPVEGPGQSECLHEHGEQQRQVLGAPDGEFVCGVEVDDLWDGVKRGAVLSQDVLPVLQMGELHMHEALAAPAGEANGRRG